MYDKFSTLYYYTLGNITKSESIAESGSSKPLTPVHQSH